MSDYCIHLQRKFADKPGEAEYQKMSYDLSEQTPRSIHEIHLILKEFCARSNGEMKYCITDYNKLNADEYPCINDNKSIIYSSEKDKL